MERGQVVDGRRTAERDDGEPSSLRAYRALAEAIQRGRFAPGARLPPERALCQQLRISRPTLRHALNALMKDGLLEAMQGSGWYVTAAVVGEPPSRLLSFHELAAQRGLTATAQVLEQIVRPATIDEADAFGVAPGTALFVLERLRFLDGVPIAISCNRLPLERAPTLPNEDFTRASLYHILEEAHGLTAQRCEYSVQAGSADAPQAELLDLAEGAPVLKGWWSAFDQEERLLEMGSIAYRGDRYRFQTTLRRTATPYPSV